jgi:hypothetical protein
MSNRKGLVGTGASLVWRHQRILWWVFAVNFILAALGGSAARVMFGKILDHSLASVDIAGRFNPTRFIELLSQPEIQFPPIAAASYVTQFIFFIFMLFIAGGIFVVYREDRRLTTAEFFENCGLYFWRFVRLTFYSLIPFAICFAIYQGIVAKIADRISEASAYESHAFWTRAIGGFIVILLFLWVRLWFDVAQVRAVAQNERRMFRNVLRAFRITWNSLGSLLWMYFRISLLAWLTLPIGIWLWLRIPGRAFFLSFLLMELVLFAQFAARLWQRASAITWYREYAEEHPAAAVEFTTPQPATIIDQPAQT